MRTRLTLHPEQQGAQQLWAQYGEQLVCVCYRYDEERQRRLKTVELIVEEKPWTPPGPRRTEQRAVAVRVAAPEVALRTQVKRAGGQWDPQRQVWLLPYERVVALGLTGRIMAERAGSEGELRSSLYR